MMMPRHANATSFKKGCKPWNRLYASEDERYAAHRKHIIKRTRANKVQIHFGISIAEYERRRKKQGVLCALCGERMRYRKGERGTSGRSPVLDHDRVTGKLREFLHRHCNVAIGMLDD